MKDEILDRFYHVLLPSVSSGKGAVIDGFFFNASFSTSDCIGDKEVDIPVIDIKDKDEFNQALVSYVSSMLSFLERYPKLQDIDYVYFRGNTEAMIDASLLNVWFNATEEDFRNPVEFLNKRKTILNNLGNYLKDKAKAEKILASIGVLPNARPENICKDDYIKMYSEILK